MNSRSRDEGNRNFPGGAIYRLWRERGGEMGVQKKKEEEEERRRVFLVG